jgi:hypothetical protein
LQVVDEKIVVLKGVVSKAMVNVGFSKLKVLEPKLFGGARSSKELENFVWDLEHYFSVAKINIDE